MTPEATHTVPRTKWAPASLAGKRARHAAAKAARRTARPVPALKREIGSELSEASRCRRAAEKEDSSGEAGRRSQRHQAATLMPVPRCKWGDPATRRPGDPATRRPGDPATRRPGDPANYSGNLNQPCQPQNAGRCGGRPQHRLGSTHKSHHHLSNPGVRPRRMLQYKRPREAHVSLLQTVANPPSQEKALLSARATARRSRRFNISSCMAVPVIVADAAVSRDRHLSDAASVPMIPPCHRPSRSIPTASSSA